MLRISTSRLVRQVGQNSLAVMRTRDSTTAATAIKTAIKTATKRRFHSHNYYYGDPVPEHQFSPQEDLVLDVTAWLVAFALCYTPPPMEVLEEEEDDNEEDEQEAVKRKKHARDRNKDKDNSSRKEH